MSEKNAISTEAKHEDKKPRITMRHWFLFPLAFLWYEILLRLFNGTPFFTNLAFPLIFAISTGLICSAITSVFPRKANRWISVFLLAVTAAFFIIECILKNTYQVYFDIFSIINGAGNVMGKYGGDVTNAIVGAVGIIVLYLLPLVLYLIFGKKRVPATRQRIRYGVILLACSFVIGCGGIIFAVNLPATSGKYSSQFEYDTATQAFGLFTSTRLDLEYDLFGNSKSESLIATTMNDANDNSNAQEIQDTDEYGANVMDIDFDALIDDSSNSAITNMSEYVSSLEPTNKNEYTGLFAGKNLIIITAEAFSSQVINEELTPTLYRLANKGIKFTDFYQPAWGGSTSTGEYSILLGLVPTNKETSMLDTIDDNLYFTMGNQLQRLGYTSLAFHNGTSEYYDRNLTHENLGYSQFIAWGSGMENLVDKLYASDKKLFTSTMPLYDTNNHFNAYYMTYSGHCVYTAESSKTQRNLDRVKEVLGDKGYKDTTLYYFCYQLELEYALEAMVDSLEEQGLADDTVIVLCTDHYPYGLAKSSTFGNDEDYLKDLYQGDYDKFTRDKTSLIIWSGCIEDMGLEVDTPTMSLDILPTLSNLFGLEYDSRLLVGRDVFSDAEPLVLWADHSFLTEHGKYDAETGTYESFDETADPSYFDTVTTTVSNKISYSTQVVKHDYFGLLFGEDDVK